MADLPSAACGNAFSGLWGSSTPGLAAVAAYRPGHNLTETDLAAAKADMSRFVAAQPDLGATLVQAIAPE